LLRLVDDVDAAGEQVLVEVFGGVVVGQLFDGPELDPVFFPVPLFGPGLVIFVVDVDADGFDVLRFGKGLLEILGDEAVPVVVSQAAVDHGLGEAVRVGVAFRVGCGDAGGGGGELEHEGALPAAELPDQTGHGAAEGVYSVVVDGDFIGHLPALFG